MNRQPIEAFARLVRAGEPDAVAAQRLLEQMKIVPAEQRDEALALLSASLATHDPGGRVLRRLATMAERAARLLALELVVRLPAPLDRSLLPIMRPLLLDRGLPLGDQFAAVVVLLQTTGKSGSAAVDLVRSLVSGLDEAQVRERLRALQQRLGKFPALREVKSRLDAGPNRRCPRCDVQLDGPLLGQHLWREHGLLLDGHEVREPWALLEDWLTEAAQRTDPDLLARCFELAQHADPEHGLARLERLLVEYGIADEDGAPRADRGGQRSSSCPHCGCPVAIMELPVKTVNVSRGRLASAGYLVEISEDGWRPRLLIETPESVLCEGREPGQRWTLRTALVLLTGPLLLTGLVVAMSLPRPEMPVTLLLLATGLLLLFLPLRARLEDQPLDRAVDHAWTLLVPKLHVTGFSTRDASFLAGLALASVSLGRPARRERPLERVVQLTERALASRSDVAGQLAILWRLAAEDSARLGRDPVLLVARLLNRCLEGDLPLMFTDALLADWDTDWWTGTSKARLRVMVCDRAFETGFEVADLVEAGRLSPTWSNLLAIGTGNYLAQLRLLWSSRSAQPWERCGEAYTVFDVAPVVRQLERYPDLLFCQFLPNSERGDEGPEAILVCGRGVVLGNTLFSHPGQALPIYPKDRDAAALARRMQTWFDFYFGEFLPQANQQAARPASQASAKLRLPEAQVCGKCRQRFLPRAGAAGIVLGTVSPRPEGAP